MAAIVTTTDFVVHTHNADPNGAITPIFVGDLLIRTDAGNRKLYIATALTNASWVETSAVSWTALTALNWMLLDNASPALDIGSTGLTNLLRFITTNGAEKIEYRGLGTFDIVAGGFRVLAGQVIFPVNSIQGPSAAFQALVTGIPSPVSRIRVDHPGGNVDSIITLPQRPGGWQVQNVFLRSRGASAGTLTLRDTAAGAGAALTDAMVPGNADILTYATTIVQAQENRASSSQLFLNGAGGPPACTGYIEVVGL
jgi:hypothetical protein